MLALAFFTTIFASDTLAEYTSYITQNPSNSLYMYQKMSQGNFFMYSDYLSADSFIIPVGATSAYHDAEELLVEPNYFQEFDYEPDVNIKLLEPLHSIDTYSVPSEGYAFFNVKYCDVYNNSPSSEYPKLTLICPDGSTVTKKMDETSGGVYILAEDLPKGTYQYTYTATNEHYAKGFYEVTGNWYVTSRPYGFVKNTPIDNVEVLPDDAQFSWTVQSDEGELYYEFYLGMEDNKSRLVKLDANTGPAVDVRAHTLKALNHKKRYYWYMRIFNKYGADIETDMYAFLTGGMVDKFYNAPNPFNPLRQKTKFVYNMPQDGTAKIVIYSEYGDKVWESDSVWGAGGTSREMTYDGRDNSGKALYNGTYLAVLTKKYAGTTKIEKCRILIVK